MALVAVVLGSDNSTQRFEDAKKMLNWGFANYAQITINNADDITVPLNFGKQEFVKAAYRSFNLIVEKKLEDKVEKQTILEEAIDAPIKSGDILGKIVCSVDGIVMYEGSVYAIESVKRNTFGSLFLEMLKKYYLI